MIKSKPYYWVECDLCGRNAQEGSDFTAWGDASSAVDAAVDGEFSEINDGERSVHICPNHQLDTEMCRECEGDLEESATSLTGEEIIQHCPHCHHIRTLPLKENP